MEYMKNSLQKCSTTYLVSICVASPFSPSATGLATFEGTPVCWIGIERVPSLISPSFGAVMVKTPSEDSRDSSFPTSWPLGITYFRTNFLEMNPCSSCFSACSPSTVTVLSSSTFTLISSGLKCCTSRFTWNLSLSQMTVDPVSLELWVVDHGRMYPLGVLVTTYLGKNGDSRSSECSPIPKCWSKILEGRRSLKSSTRKGKSDILCALQISLIQNSYTCNVRLYCQIHSTAFIYFVRILEYSSTNSTNGVREWCRM